jgi:hypothetical protein
MRKTRRVRKAVPKKTPQQRPQHIYHSIQQNYTLHPSGQTEARVTTVDIEDGKGVKGVMIVDPSGKRRRTTQQLSQPQIQKITSNIFVPRLFSLKRTRSRKQRDAS